MDMQSIESQLSEFKSQLEALDKKIPEDKISLIVFSGDLDKVLASFVIANGGVAMGMDVVMFFTFWGTPLLRDKNKKVGGKDVMGKIIVSEESGKKFGAVSNIDFITESGELLNLVVDGGSKALTELNLKVDERGRTLIPFSAVKSIGDFVIVSENELL